MIENILELQNLTMHFTIGSNRIIKAVEDINLEIQKGETFGLVGESGCGKSTLGRMIKGIYKPTAGHIIFQGIDILKMNIQQKKAFQRNMQIIFQDPYSSLNPRMTVRELLGEGLEIHKLGDKKQREKKIYDCLEMVGLNPEYVTRFAHEFSGGQRQRLAIARALAVEPKFIICDEPISSLDVSIQGQIVNLLKDLQYKLGLTYLFIAHDLSMVKYISDRVGVMYLGRIVEIAPKKELFENPKHPYTQVLLSSIPIPDPKIERNRKEIIIEGEIPSATEKINGCSFKSRCPFASSSCEQMEYTLKNIGKQHYIMCAKFQ
jgi:oligopeptide transport system ATP-binding protein